MDTVQNTGNEASRLGSPQGAIDDRAREYGRVVDPASARLQPSWSNVAGDLKSKFGSTSGHLKYKLQLAGEKTKQRLLVARHEAAVKAKDYKVSVEGQVQKHPMRSIGIAVAAGAILGLWVRRRRH